MFIESPNSLLSSDKYENNEINKKPEIQHLSYAKWKKLLLVTSKH